MIRFYSTSTGFKAKLIIGVVLLLIAAGLTVIALLALGIILFLLPALVLTAVIYALLPKRSAGRRPYGGKPPQVLEGRYRVVRNRNENPEP